MRTTITLDDDVARRIEQLRGSTRRSFKGLVNDLLRRGLDAKTPPRAKVRYRTASWRAEPFVANLDDVAQALAVAEGEAFR